MNLLSTSKQFVTLIGIQFLRVIN